MDFTAQHFDETVAVDKARIVFLSIKPEQFRDVSDPLPLLISPFFLLQWSSFIAIVPSNNLQLIFLLLQHFLIGILLISTCCRRMIPRNAITAKILKGRKASETPNSPFTSATSAANAKEIEQSQKSNLEDSQKGKKLEDSKKEMSASGNSESLPTTNKKTLPNDKAPSESFLTSIISSQDSSKIIDSVAAAEDTSKQKSNSTKKHQKSVQKREGATAGGEAKVENSEQSVSNSTKKVPKPSSTSTKKGSTNNSKSDSSSTDEKNKKTSSQKPSKSSAPKKGCDELMTENTPIQSPIQSDKGKKAKGKSTDNGNSEDQKALKAMPGSARSLEKSVSKKPSLIDSTLPSRDDASSHGKKVAERDFFRKMMEDEQKEPVQKRVSSSEQFISGLKIRKRKSALNENYEPPADSLKLSLDVEMLAKGENRVNSLKPDPQGTEKKVSSHMRKIEATRTLCQYVHEICTGAEVAINREGKVDRKRRQTEVSGSKLNTPSSAPTMESKSHHLGERKSVDQKTRLALNRLLQKRFSSRSDESHKLNPPYEFDRQQRKHRRKKRPGRESAQSSPSDQRTLSPTNSSLLTFDRLLIRRKPSPKNGVKSKSRSLATGSVEEKNKKSKGLAKTPAASSIGANISADSKKDQSSQLSSILAAESRKKKGKTIMEVIPTTPKTAAATPPKPDILVQESTPPTKASFLRSIFEKPIKNSKKAGKKSNDATDRRSNSKKRRNQV